ncbi:hypothetical protein CBF34_04215 [Vagococcus penaei]|uniref:Uncharacterized protein n=1 Tax=Vagococcus penaei TaxID=633807 RepID=A0A1Q2D946_9ENTE|nr:YitT family protein [Vagococcus penaei]AQP54845.1 hypothetical protein BW732_11310 [Vagococcus penaei]RSU05415.1 hypothetical protein CBF34_04215 [Vagococcus penaei]
MMKRIAVMLLAGVLIAAGLNWFLVPANVFSVGVNGISQLMSSTLFSLTGISVNTGILIFLLNVPIAILGWIKLGRSATIYSLLTVVCVSVMAILIPIEHVTNNPLMSAIAGGVLTGLATGLTMKYGFSTGGMDIVSLVLAKTTGRTVGSLMFAINILIVIAAGFLFSWEAALYTMISIYCTTQVLDTVHTSHQKVTAFIMTSKPNETIKSIQSELIRGMTILPGTGAYSKKEVSMLMIVVTRYELYTLEQCVYAVDEDAFINIMPTQTVMGKFWNEDEQKKIREELKKV